MAAAPPLNLDQVYLDHLDKEENQYAILRSSGLSDLLVEKLRSKNLITEEEAGKIRGFRETDQYGRGLEFLRILRLERLRFATREKIADFIYVFEHKDHPRPTVKNVFSSYRDEHLQQLDNDKAVGVDGKLIQPVLIPGSRGPVVVVGEIHSKHETNYGVVLTGSVNGGNLKVDQSKTVFKR